MVHNQSRVSLEYDITIPDKYATELYLEVYYFFHDIARQWSHQAQRNHLPRLLLHTLQEEGVQSQGAILCQGATRPATEVDWLPPSFFGGS